MNKNKTNASISDVGIVPKLLGGLLLPCFLHPYTFEIFMTSPSRK